MSILKEVRNRFAITQEQMGLYLGITRSFIAFLESTDSSVPSRLDDRLLELEALYEQETNQLDGEIQFQSWMLVLIRAKFEKLILTNARLLAGHEKDLEKIKKQYRILMVHIRVTDYLINRYGHAGDLFMKRFKALKDILNGKLKIC